MVPLAARCATHGLARGALKGVVALREPCCSKALARIGSYRDHRLRFDHRQQCESRSNAVGKVCREDENLLVRGGAFHALTSLLELPDYRVADLRQVRCGHLQDIPETLHLMPALTHHRWQASTVSVLEGVRLTEAVAE
jgi:hypothetical protein